MPRFEYGTPGPTAAADKTYDRWLGWLDEQFAGRDVDHRSEVVRNVLHELYLGKPYSGTAREVATAASASGLSSQVLTANFDPRNITLEPEYYGDVDAQKYAERKPLIYFWMMFDRSPAGLNHHLGFKVRRVIGKHVFKHLGENVKIFHGVEVSFGYNLVVEDRCTIHKYVMLDDRGGIILREGTSVSDYANIYSHTHDVNDGMLVSNIVTEVGPRARITYHATVLAGVRVNEQGMVGAMAVATKEVPAYHVRVGIPAKTVKVKDIAPEAVKAAAQKK